MPFIKAIDYSYEHLAGSDDENADICLRGAAYHIGHIVLVARRIQDCVALGSCFEVRPPDLHVA